MALPAVLPPPNHVIVGADPDGRPDLPLGTAEKRFYDWLLAVQRVMSGKGGIIGSTDGSNAVPGEVGEYVSAELIQSSSLSLVSGTAANITSIPLTAGDWRVWFNGRFLVDAGTTLTGALFSISTATGALQDAPNSRTGVLPVPTAGLIGAGPNGIMSCIVGPTRIVTTTPITVYAVARATFGGSTLFAYGHLQAERRR